MTSRTHDACSFASLLTVAAVVLVTSHYAAKYREPIKDLALRVGRNVVEGGKFIAKKMEDFEDKIGSIGNEQVDIDVLDK